MEPLYCEHLGDLVKGPVESYSILVKCPYTVEPLLKDTPEIRTPLY